MVDHELLRDEGILVIRPEGSLEAADFQEIAQEIDPYITANGRLHGVLIDAESFPDWKDLAALAAHLRFAREHHRKIEKVAVVSDSNFISSAPQIAGHFVQGTCDAFPIRKWMKRLPGFKNSAFGSAPCCRRSFADAEA